MNVTRRPPYASDRNAGAAVDQCMVAASQTPGCGNSCAGRELCGVAAADGSGARTDQGGRTSIFIIERIWHARRQLENGRVVMGVGYDKAAAVADLESQWGMS